MEIEERFWSKVDVGADDECWPWTAGLDKQGYGVFSIAGRGATAHRVAYELLNGHEAGGIIDHTCHNAENCVGGPQCQHRRCMNPLHHEVTTRAANASKGRRVDWQGRRTHCPQGHPYSGRNLIIRTEKHGGRRCRACKSAGRKRAKAARLIVTADRRVVIDKSEALDPS